METEGESVRFQNLLVEERIIRAQSVLIYCCFCWCRFIYIFFFFLIILFYFLSLCLHGDFFWVLLTVLLVLHYVVLIFVCLCVQSISVLFYVCPQQENIRQNKILK